MSEIIKKLYWFFSSQLGIDFWRLIKSMNGVPRYFLGVFQYSRKYKGRFELRPCLFDWYEEGGITKNEYFWQDLYIARQIFQANPIKHVDIGSRIDGLVAHVASFRDIEVFDIRPITAKISGIIFKQADLMNPPAYLVDYCDSLSCLHALEHFGLGRYGDPIDPQGGINGLKNMSIVLRKGGVFYLSVPIGIERVEFNAHQIFDPFKLTQIASEFGLKLKEFSWYDANFGLIQSSNIERDMLQLSENRYALGIFSFQKI